MPDIPVTAVAGDKPQVGSYSGVNQIGFVPGNCSNQFEITKLA